jgi:hypothetical protein
MILDTLALFDDKAAITVTRTSTSSYDMVAAGGDGASLANVTNTDGSGGGGAGASASPAALGPPGTAANIGAPLLHDIGRGKPVMLLVQVTTTFTAAGAGTLTADLLTSTDSPTLVANLTTVVSSGAIGKASLVPGYRFPYKYLPPKVPLRYMGMNYTVATGPMTAGALSAGIVFGMDEHANVFA